MARPIPETPDFDLRKKSKKDIEEVKSKESKSIFDISDGVCSNTSKNFLLGTFSGWMAGVTAVRVGKIAAFGLGGGVILLHCASELGYIHVNWERVKESARQTQACLDWLLKLIRHNGCFSVGFVVISASHIAAVPCLEHERPLPPEPIPPKPPESYKQEEPHIFEKPTFLPKPIPHSPKISPSSIPNPSPSVTTTKQVESGYPNFGGYLYSIPGFSAFQPVNHSGMPGYHPGLIQQNQPAQSEPSNSDFVPFQQPNPSTDPTIEDDSMDTDALLMVTDDEGTQPPPSQTDFEEHFTPEIISTVPTVSSPEVIKPQATDSQMSITSLTQGSGATVTIPSLIPNKEPKKKTERFSLKTSIPISKIDMKCVSNPPDSLFQNSLTKKSFSLPFNKDSPRIEIQSNIVIKSATKESEVKDIVKPVVASSTVSTLINAAETNKTENQFRTSDTPKPDPPTDTKNTPSVSKPIFNPMNIENSKTNFNKPPERDSFTNDAKNQILFIQNKNNNNQNQKMLLTLQQQNPQVLLQRTNFESKNLQAPSRLSNPSKKCKEDVVNEGTSSKVVALKRLHQENCDENDFENLITENQIYGNKIVVKEKSQGTQQEQDLKNKKITTEKVATNESKNVVLQPNFLYLSNVQFPNMMIVKNNAKVQTMDSNKPKITTNENKATDTNIIAPPADVNTVNTGNKTTKSVQPAINKELHVLKSSNNVKHTVSNKTKPESNIVTSKPDKIIAKSDLMITKPDNVVVGKPDNILITKSDVKVAKPEMVITKPELIFQPNQKVIVSPQIVYQVPISSMVEGDKINQPTIMNVNSKDYPKFVTPKTDYSKQFEQTNTNDKLFIACPYQMDSKSQPKIVITNLRTKVNKTEEISSLDIYEKRKRLRRLKYLSNRDNIVSKDFKTEMNSPTSVVVQPVKKVEKSDLRNIITQDKIHSEIYKEFASTRCKLTEEICGSDSDDCDELELKQYQSIIEEYGNTNKRANIERRKSEFLSNFRLASQDIYKEKDLELQERMLKHDKVRSAYAAIGRLDILLNISQGEIVSEDWSEENCLNASTRIQENLATLRNKMMFLSHLNLTQVTQKYKEEYEEAWEVIMKERLRRDCSEEDNSHSTQWAALHLDTKRQLQMMTEIKHCVNENNNLIKKMLDTVRDKQSNEESISVLAEKNFCELHRLSKMADRSVKLVSGNTRKRDLNPGFDSENIQKHSFNVEQPFQNYPKLNIPNISKIISLKSTEQCEGGTTTQATSMDEPKSSAAGVAEMFHETKQTVCKVDMGCQAEENLWSGVENIVKVYRDYDTIRRREIAELHRRNTSLRVEGAHITRAASRDSDRARALLAERQNLAMEENNLRLSLQKLRQAIDEVKNYTGQHDFC